MRTWIPLLLPLLFCFPLAADQPGSGITVALVGVDTSCDDDTDYDGTNMVPKGETVDASWGIAGGGLPLNVFAVYRVNGGPQTLVGTNGVQLGGGNWQMFHQPIDTSGLRRNDQIEIWLQGTVILTPTGNPCGFVTPPVTVTVTLGGC